MTQVARKLAERLSRGVVLRRKLPPHLGGGVVYVTPEASLRFWKPSLADVDPFLLSLATDFVLPGSVVWDIGANVGLFTFAAAYLAGPRGHVVAVEPDPWLASLLRRSATHSPEPRARLDICEMAVAESSGIASFAVARRGRAANHLERVAGSSQAGGVRDRLTVSTCSLDDLLLEFGPPAFVKIDVEGAEALCLRGGQRLLSEVRPIVVCEVAAANQQPVAAIFDQARYAMFNAAYAPSAQRPLSKPAWNTLARPL